MATDISNTKIGKIIAPIFLLIFAIVLTVVSISALKTYGPGYGKVQGVITDMPIRSYDNDDGVSYDVIVKYTVDGVEYERIAGEYDSSFYPGKSIEVRYDKSNPYKISISTPIMNIVFAVIAVVFYVLAVVLTVGIFKSKKKQAEQNKREAFSGFNTGDTDTNDSDGFPL